MIKNTFMANKRKGFSLIELVIVLSIISILIGTITPIFIKQAYIKAAERTALEMSAVQEAARAYYIQYKGWPPNLWSLRNGNFLNPSWSFINPWGNPYAWYSTANSCTVYTNMPAEWTSVILRDLPQVVRSGTYVESTIPIPGSESTLPSIPSGIIAAWSGTLSTIPQNWVLCDGTNGTPDLRNRFIMGAGSSYSPGQTGGSTTASGSTDNHTLTIAEMPSHYHYEYGGGGGGGSPYAIVLSPVWNGTLVWTGQYTAPAGGDQPHSHTITNLNVLNPYYALAYIMKT